MKLKIAIVVHGRFHAFDLARALLKRGHDVTVFTNYPKWAGAKFDLPKDRIRSFWAHGLLSRVAWKWKRLVGYPEAWLHRLFGQWACGELLKERWDAIHIWSGVAEETLAGWSAIADACFLMRGSAHVRTQARLLAEEAERTGAQLDCPSAWMIAREEREYALAGAVLVLSTFSRQTFLNEGVSPDKVRVLLSGAELQAFRPPPAVIRERCARILSGAPLRILNVGTFSFQKGMWDFAPVIRTLPRNSFEFRFVGPVADEASQLAESLTPRAVFVPKQPQQTLPAQYAWGDIFLLPSIQDGFQTVLGQAAAAALPILTTPNGAGRDLVHDGESGWVLPIRNPQALIERLQWCNTHREELAAMVERIYNDFQPRDWSAMAADFEALCSEETRLKRA